MGIWIIAPHHLLIRPSYTAGPIILARNPPRAITHAGLAEIEGPGLRGRQQANCATCADKQSVCCLAAGAWSLFRKQFYDDRMHFVGGDVFLHDEATIWWLDRSLYCPALSSTSVFLYCILYFPFCILYFQYFVFSVFCIC